MQNKNIVVASDFSPRSIEIIKKAEQFAKKNSANLHIVHAVEIPFFSAAIDINSICASSYETLLQHFPKFEKHHYHCQSGNIEDVIANYCHKVDAKLLILASSGERNSLKKLLLGSSIKSIIRELNIPAIVVKSDNELDFSHVMITTDLSEKSLEFITKVKAILPQSNIKLFYTYALPYENRLHFYGLKDSEISLFQKELKSEAQKEVEQFFEKLPIEKNNVEMVFQEGYLDTEFFINEAKKMNSDLIAMHTTGKFSFFALDLLEDSDIDVMIAKV